MMVGFNFGELILSLLLLVVALALIGAVAYAISVGVLKARKKHGSNTPKVDARD